MSKDKNIPKIRFPGFTDGWELRKLGDIAGSVIGGGTPKTSVGEYWDGDIPWIQSSNVQEDEMFDFDIPKKITQLGLDKSAAKLVPKNSIAVVTHVSVGKLVFVPFAYTTSQDFTSLAELKTDPQFTCYSLYKRLQDDLHIVQGSAIKGITKDDLLTKEIMIPEKDEQCKIGKCFRNLDNLITFHQCKYEAIKSYKAAMLQKMFPREGERVPEIRFPGFTDDWEQRKFCDIADIKTGPFGSTLHAGDYVDDGTPIITTEHFKNGSLPNAKENLPQVSDEDYKRLSSYILNEGDIVFSRVGSVDINAVTTRFQEGWLFSGRVLRARPKDSVDSIFVHALLETETVKKNIRDRAVGQTMPSINTEILGVTPLVFPKDLEEQTKIGKVFSELDNLITLHLRKCEEIKEYKKGLLQQMFV